MWGFFFGRGQMYLKSCQGQFLCFTECTSSSFHTRVLITIRPKRHLFKPPSLHHHLYTRDSTQLPFHVHVTAPGLHVFHIWTVIKRSRCAYIHWLLRRMTRKETNSLGPHTFSSIPPGSTPKAAFQPRDSDTLAYIRHNAVCVEHNAPTFRAPGHSLVVCDVSMWAAFVSNHDSVHPTSLQRGGYPNPPPPHTHLCPSSSLFSSSSSSSSSCWNKMANLDVWEIVGYHLILSLSRPFSLSWHDFISDMSPLFIAFVFPRLSALAFWLSPMPAVQMVVFSFIQGTKLQSGSQGSGC